MRSRPYVPLMILLAGCMLTWRARSQEAIPLAGPLSSVLADMPGYSITNNTLSADERGVAGMSDYVARSYSRGGAVAFTTLVSYYARQTQGKTIHSPRNCLPGAGWEIVDGGATVIHVDGAALPVNRFVLRSGAATAVAYYWYQGRGRVTANEYAVKWNLLRDAAVLGHSEEALVRIVLPVSSSQRAPTANEPQVLQRTDSTARAIAARLVREVNAVLPSNRQALLTALR